MIAKSDLIILLVSTTALAVGVFRWQANTDQPLIASGPVAVAITQTLDSDTSLANDAGDRAASDNLARVDGDAASATANARPLTGAGDSAAVQGTTGNSPQASSGDATGSSAVVAVADGVNEGLYGVYTVQSGDYLSKIAEEFGTSVDTLMSINGLQDDTIMIDQPLRYPLPAN